MHGGTHQHSLRFLFEDQPHAFGAGKPLASAPGGRRRLPGRHPAGVGGAEPGPAARQ